MNRTPDRHIDELAETARHERCAEREPARTLTGHLEELRRRLGVCVVVLVVAVGVSFSQVERLISWLQRPAEGLLPRFAFFSPTEPLLAYVKVSLLAGAILAMPVILSQAWAFIQTGLTERERRAGLIVIWWGSCLFLAGAAFAYYGLLPASLTLLLGLGTGYLEPVISVDRYLSFVTGLVFWCGLLFELPAVLFILARVGVVTPAWLRHQRPYAVLVLLIIAALVTPTTDPVSLLLMAVPLVGLYELSIVVTRWAMPPGGGRSP